MQSENRIKESLKNFYSDLGTKKIGQQVSPFFFYNIEVPAILLDKSDKTIDTSDKLNS